LHEHAARAAAGIEDAAFVRGEHLDQDTDDTAWGVELAALLAFFLGGLARRRGFGRGRRASWGTVLGGRLGFGLPSGANQSFYERGFVTTRVVEIQTPAEFLQAIARDVG